jgi:hypothetical protein
MSRTIKSGKTTGTRDGSPVPGELVRATRTADIVAVPHRRCLAIDGAGPPQEARFAEAVGALYGTAYALKFGRKRSGKHDFKVGPLESHWSADAPPAAKTRPAPETWRWRLRLGVPSDVTHDEIEHIKRDVVAKKHGKLEGSRVVAHIFLESIPAQRLGRILHVGSYSDEGTSLDLVDAALAHAKLAPAPAHIEVYLKDPSRTRPDALETILLRELAR